MVNDRPFFYLQRMEHLTYYEKKLQQQGFNRILGLDEVGRGCLAGPVVAAGVILDLDNLPDGINDSKQLSSSERVTLSIEIKKRARFWTINECSIKEIDTMNILWASLHAMHLCESHQDARPDYLLIDGNRYIPTLIPHSCIVKGDANSASIAAASILAKVYRDDMMGKLHKEYPEFNWKSNVGYPTKEHYEALAKYGATVHHRRSFNLKTELEYVKQTDSYP